MTKTPKEEVHFVRGEVLDDESPTSANLGNDHEFINKEYSPHWYETFWGSPKQTHESLCSKWTISYHCGESCSSNTSDIYQNIWKKISINILQLTLLNKDSKRLLSLLECSSPPVGLMHCW